MEKDSMLRPLTRGDPVFIRDTGCTKWTRVLVCKAAAWRREIWESIFYQISTRSGILNKST